MTPLLSFKEKEMLSSVLIIVCLLIAIAITYYVRKWVEKRER